MKPPEIFEISRFSDVGGGYRELCMFFFIAEFCTMGKTRTFHFPHSTEIECCIFFRSWRDIFYNMGEMSHILFPYYQYIAEVIYMFFTLFLLYNIHYMGISVFKGGLWGNFFRFTLKAFISIRMTPGIIQNDYFDHVRHV